MQRWARPNDRRYKGLFSGPKMPAIQPPTPMPDNTALDAARRRRIAQEQQGQTWNDTILSTGGRETLGG